MASLSALTEPRSLCYKCQELNLPSTEQCKELRVNCVKCNRPYGEKHASKLDTHYCEECLNDFQVTKQDYICAGVESYKEELLDQRTGKPILDESGKPVIKERRRPYQTKSTQIILFGNDWIFNEITISQMTQEQLENAIEWHRANVSLMESEITRHKIEKAHKLAQVKVPIPEKNKQLAAKNKERTIGTLAESLGAKLKPEELAALIQKLQGGGK